MYIGRVKGTVVSTIKHRQYNAYKLLLVARLNLDGEESGAYDIAIDDVQAGVGDIVVVMDEGNSARQILRSRNGAVRATIVAVVEQITIRAT